MIKWLCRTFLIVLALAGMFALGTYAYLQHPKFGDLAEGASLEAIKRSPNYADGVFHNVIETPMRTQDTSFAGNVLSMLLDSNERLTPSAAVPSVKQDLKALNRAQDVIVWLGHSSYFVQVGGKGILIDPVFSLEAAPAPRLNTAFAGSTPVLTLVGAVQN
jgi:hypothetical protein